MNSSKRSTPEYDKAEPQEASLQRAGKETAHADMPGAEEVRRLVTLNWQEVLREVRAAADAAGRRPDTVRVVGVSKYVDAEVTEALVQAGCHDLGESRPQVLWKKAEALSGSADAAELSDLRWHMIGHVQTNKLRRLLRHRPLIHSVDSERLLKAINDESQRQGFVTDVLLEINISGDDNKTGLAPDQVAELLGMDSLPHTRIRGLMAMAGWGTDSQSAKEQFQRVAAIRDELAQRTGTDLPELSMGMSGDFREAIAAGATLVRIGSALFHGVL